MLHLLALAWLATITGAAAQPVPNQVYPIGEAPRAPPGIAWQAEDESGRVIPAPDGILPPDGWYRMLRRETDGTTTPLGGRFAIGVVVIVTGQSQASSLFDTAPAAAGAFPAGRDDPPAPPFAAMLADEAAGWTTAIAPLGARILLAELARHLGPGIPLGLVNAAWGNSSAAMLADPATPAGARLRRMAATPASAALILAHGTTDVLVGTPPSVYAERLSAIVATLRTASPAMPVLLAPLPPLLGRTTLLGSGRLAMLLPGLARRQPLDPHLARHAEAIRAAQARLGLPSGGDMAGIVPGLDGIHWTEAGVRQATREAAAALATALRSAACTRAGRCL
ncbi:SGNH/GDSL hydrolase family protein [Belnapia sp. T18]|uniref:SGNH/GDSL hydrolase family protein n=1 Tax=Belnapia arida TaxID=2804533 RepID=A0ABS1U4H8_9PROT|nr:SGNH/GDSL hydrolase family protein [Belnapia arida]MBL6079573.1 SGNH/GDSL hydrolase family protein [Belnapia arida]